MGRAARRRVGRAGHCGRHAARGGAPGRVAARAAARRRAVAARQAAARRARHAPRYVRGHLMYYKGRVVSLPNLAANGCADLRFFPIFDYYLVPEQYAKVQKTIDSVDHTILL